MEKNTSSKKVWTNEDLTKEEVKYLNSLEVDSCPYCGSKRISKNGFRSNGIQRYVCRECKKGFQPTTGTLFDNHKVTVSGWMRFIKDFMENLSQNKTFQGVKSTAEYWMFKISKALGNWHGEVMISGEVLAGVIKAESTVTERTRNSQGKYHSSTVQRDIYLAYMTNGREIAVAEVEKGDSFKALLKRISPGSVIIHDGTADISSLLTEKGYEERLLKNDESGMAALKESVEKEIAEFIERHSLVPKIDMKGWLDVFRFVYAEKKDDGDKVAKDLLDAVMDTKKVVRFREKDRLKTA